jgi:hypothetical protein
MNARLPVGAKNPCCTILTPLPCSPGVLPAILVFGSARQQVAAMHLRPTPATANKQGTAFDLACHHLLPSTSCRYSPCLGRSSLSPPLLAVS